MNEKSPLNQEKLALVQQALVITSIGDLSRFGPPDEVLQYISTQVSDQIDAYLEDHPGEMLRQSPEKVAAQLKSGKSLMMLTNEPNPRVLFHGTMYENFSPEIVNYLGGYQVVELGSVITDPDFRGLGLATKGCREIISHVKKLNHHTLCIATIKQEMTAIVLATAGMSTVSYHDYPHLANLTCTCTDCSENFGHVCPFRRSIANSIPDILSRLTNKSHPPGKTDCTLMVSDPIVAGEVESHFSSLNQPVSDISISSMLLVSQFFAKVALYAKQ